MSTVDPESRHVHKTQHAYRDGFKAHVAAEPDTGLITATDLTAGNVGDATAAAGLVADEPAGTEVLGDSAYGAGEFREHLDNEQMRAVIKPPPLRPAVPGGYTIDDFDIDEEGQTVTCPAGPPCGSRRRGTRRSGPDARRVRSERDALPPSTGARSSCIRNIVSSPPRE